MRFVLALLLLANQQCCTVPQHTGATAASGGGGGITIVQHKSTTSGASNVTSLALAFTSNNATGNLLIYFSAQDGASNNLTIATDNNSNTIVNALTKNGTGSGEYRVDCVNASASGANTVTAHATSAARMHLHIWEVSGMSATACTALDASNTGLQAATSQSISTSAGTTHANDLVLGAFYDVINDDSLTAGTGFSPSEFADGGTGNESSLTEVKIVSSTGTQTATATCGSGANTIIQGIIAFKGT